MYLADVLRPKRQAVTQAKFNGLWSVTECIGCPGALLHRAAGCPTEGFDPMLLALFRDGLMHEDIMVEQLKAAGVVIIRFNQGVVDTDLPIIGHPDGMISPDTLVEFKTIKDSQEVEDILINHKKYNPQGHGYARILRLPHIKYIVKVRSTGWVLDDIDVEYDPEVANAIWKVVESAQAVVARGRVECPTKEPFLTCSDDYVTRQQCPYYGHCKPDNTKSVSDYLGALVWDDASYRVLKNEAQEQLDVLEGKIKAAMRKEGLKSFKARGISVSLYDTGRRSVKWEEAEKLVSPDVQKEIFFRNEWEQLTIRLPKELQPANKKVTGEAR